MDVDTDGAMQTVELPTSGADYRNHYNKSSLGKPDFARNQLCFDRIGTHNLGPTGRSGLRATINEDLNTYHAIIGTDYDHDVHRFVLDKQGKFIFSHIEGLPILRRCKTRGQKP